MSDKSDRFKRRKSMLTLSDKSGVVYVNTDRQRLGLAILLVACLWRYR